MGTKTELVNTRNQTKVTLKLVGPLKFYDNILTELQRDVKNLVKTKKSALDFLAKTGINILKRNLS